jgi:hypothetical protein
MFQNSVQERDWQECSVGGRIAANSVDLFGRIRQGLLVSPDLLVKLLSWTQCAFLAGAAAMLVYSGFRL